MPIGEHLQMPSNQQADPSFYSAPTAKPWTTPQLRFRRRRRRHLRIIINIDNELARLKPRTEVIDFLNLLLFLFHNASNLTAAAPLHALPSAASIATAPTSPWVVGVAGPDVRAFERAPLALRKHNARTGRRGLAECRAALARSQGRDGTDVRRALPDEADVGREGGGRGRRGEHFDAVVWAFVFLGGAADGRYAGRADGDGRCARRFAVRVVVVRHRPDAGYRAAS